MIIIVYLVELIVQHVMATHINVMNVLQDLITLMVNVSGEIIYVNKENSSNSSKKEKKVKVKEKVKIKYMNYILMVNVYLVI